MGDIQGNEEIQTPIAIDSRWAPTSIEEIPPVSSTCNTGQKEGAWHHDIDVI